METNVLLKTMPVGEIEGSFFVPSYQRGYRWTNVQVETLLNDIWESCERNEKTYCLQPIVVKNDGHEQFELIDGQQRLTTLLIIYKCIDNSWNNFSLTYETRQGNVEFLNHIDDEAKADDNIDFFFMHRAFMAIKNWFANKKENVISDVVQIMKNSLDKYVKVIWYEMKSGTREDATKLFTRLNIGRIPLTNAELIKALFLGRNVEKNNKQLEEKRQLEVSLQWDLIERELHDDSFWSFLTNEDAAKYPTRIELLFDFYASQRENKKDPFSIFLFFNDKKNVCNDLSKLWEENVRYFYKLKEWYTKNSYYHKIGYLIASGSMKMSDIIALTDGKKKKVQEDILDEIIRKSIAFNKSYSELNYEKDYDEIWKLLLLFNVISVYKNGGHSRFPFNEFKTEKWSLEHIHAQHSEKLNKKEQWITRLKENIESIKEYVKVQTDDEKKQRANKVSNIIEKELEDEESITKESFTQLDDEYVSSIFGNESSSIHTLSNMALLQVEANSALNNSTFDVKRRKIIEFDKDGVYIPYCTRMVFLKYYTLETSDQLSYFFWNEKDKAAYINNMNSVLSPYLKEKIIYVSE